MARFALLFIIGGGVLAWFGYQEFTVSQGASSEPTAVEVATLEKGEQPKSTYVKLGEHLAIFGAAIYEVPASAGKTDNPQTTVNHCYYPVISKGHSWAKEFNDLVDKHNGRIPDNVPIPNLHDIVVLVKSNRYRTVGQLPNGIKLESSLQGLIINRIKALDEKESKKLREAIPTLDTAKVVIIEEGREPASLVKSLGMAGGGALLILIGISSFFMGSKQSKPPQDGR